MTFLLLSMPGPTELILIIAVLLILFGGKKIPELMRGAGRGIKEFKDAMNTPTTPEEPKKEEDTTKKDEQK